MNGKHENRVLGRVLAVEEAMNVSGARPTLPLYDNLTKPSFDTLSNAECGRALAANGASINSSTGTVLTPISGN